MKKTIFAAAVLAGLMGSAAIAQGGPMGPGPMGGVSFEELDANSDGALTLEELQARPAARFAEADTNGDGALSVEEVQAAMMRQRAEGMIARMDSNGDGLLQMDEMQPGDGQGLSRMFDRVDADSSGDISAEEFAAMQDKMAERGQGGRGGNGEGRGHGGRDGGRGHGGGFFGFGGN